MVFVEHLTGMTWLFHVLPHLVKINREGKERDITCYYLDGTRTGVWIARLTAGFCTKSFRQFTYKIHDVLDDKGMSTFLKVIYLDSIKIQNEIRKNGLFRDFLAENRVGDRFPPYLEKSLHTYDMQNSGTYDHLLNAQMLIRVCAWKCKQAGQNRAFLFLRRRLWFPVFEKEAARLGITLISLPHRLRINSKTVIRKIFSHKTISFIQYAMTHKTIPRMKKKRDDVVCDSPCLATEYYGHLNLDKRERYSDLFFFQQSELSGSDIRVFFSLPSDPLDDLKNAQLEKYGINAIALSPVATRLKNSTIHNEYPSRNRRQARGRTLEERWMDEMCRDYQYWRSYWKNIFERYNIRLYTSWLKYDAAHFAIADAMDSLGGITTIYQRSYQTAPIPSTTIDVDIAFSFSADMARIENQNNSKIKYLVTTGYIGDHRFSLLREKARSIRRDFESAGARHILSYFDENTIDDSRWYLDHSYAMDNYTFLLQKVLDYPEFGLLLKPKTPATLIRRLGPVAALMEKARATGRCRVFLDGAIQGSDPPALAALSADVAVHDGITSPTAGMESALCKVPTLLLDREGWPNNVFCDLDTGKVLFRNWEMLWEGYISYIGSAKSTPGFGDWSPIMHQLDPFQDGRGAERVGTYLKWLIDGLKSGKDKNKTMVEAATRYCEQWGNDKIVSIPGKYPK